MFSERLTSSKLDSDQLGGRAFFKNVLLGSFSIFPWLSAFSIVRAKQDPLGTLLYSFIPSELVVFPLNILITMVRLTFLSYTIMEAIKVLGIFLAIWGNSLRMINKLLIKVVQKKPLALFSDLKKIHQYVEISISLNLINQSISSVMGPLHFITLLLTVMQIVICIKMYEFQPIVQYIANIVLLIVNVSLTGWLFSKATLPCKYSKKLLALWI